MRAWRRSGMELVSTRPRPEGFYDPKNPAGLAMPGERAGNATPPAPPPATAPQTGGTPQAGQRSAALRAERGRAAGRRRTGLRQFRSRVQRHAHGHGQLPRLQRLRHRKREEPAPAGVGGLPRRPGRRFDLRQPAVHVGRADARPRRLRHAGRGRAGEQGTVPRRADLRHHRHSQAQAGGGGADLPWLAHPYARAEGQADALCLWLRHRRRPLGRGTGRLLRRRSEGEPEHGTLQHRRDRSAARRAREGARRQSAAHFLRREDRRHRRPVPWRRSWSRHAAQQHHQPVPRHHGVPGSRPRGRRLLGQRHPDGHQRSGQPEAPRSRRRQELCLLALGDVQQRRHQGDLHRRMGRRHASALPRRPTS